MLPMHRAPCFTISIRCDWDEELLQLLEVPKSMLPEVKNTSELFGNTATQLFSADIPDCRCSGRPAGSALRTDVHEEGNGEEHIRNRLFYADEYRRSAHLYPAITW